MAESISIRGLAARMAGVARELRDSEGDLVAQRATYSAFLDWLDNSQTTPPSQPLLLDQLQSDLRRLDSTSVFADWLAEDKDPRIYFYEEFLRAYDPGTSKGRRVHYSPPAVLSYMLRCVKTILNEQFGQAAEQATIVDPCCGIGTFLRAIGSADMPHKRVIGMELSAPACALAAELVAGCEILNADSLQDIDLNAGDGPLAVIGNPPYSGHSANAGAIADLLADYKTGLTERNPKWLQDDYVKFIRMAQHRIDQSGQGIIAFITNHSYLVNPTFRAMRTSLMHSFNQVYALNLYGNALTNQESELPDENIFAIRMGVAIVFMVKKQGSSGCSVMHAGIRGTRAHKLDTLKALDFHTTPWHQVIPSKPFSIFAPTNASLQKEFYGFASLFDLFGEHSVGFVTSRDGFAIDTDREALLKRIADLRNPDISPEQIQAKYHLTDLNITRARRELMADPCWQDKAVEVTYRPFDKRWAYYSRAIMERPRLPFMESLLMDNIALAIGRAGQVTGSNTWDVAFITDKPADLNLFRRGGAMLFPLYIYEAGKRRYNLVQHNAEFFYYIYALLLSRTYRDRYAEFLAIDYPRIPCAPNDSTLAALSALGRQLADTHLMRTDTFAESQSATMRIGGWDIPGKYLKDRKNRPLSSHQQASVTHINGIVRHTLTLQNEIDAVIAGDAPWTGSSDGLIV